MINMTKHLGDDMAMERLSMFFSKRPKGVLKGAIGALDGWLVRIVRPGWIRDMIKILLHSSLGKYFMPSIANV